MQPPVFRGLNNYQALFGDPIFWKCVRVTVYYASLTLPLGMIFAFVLALLLNMKMRGQTIFRTIIFIPSLVPVVASAMVWLWLFNPKLGLINIVLTHLGMTNPPGWLGDSRWAIPALVIMTLWGVGNTVIIYLAGLQDVPRELYEAADLDGASPLGRIWHVTIPCISPVIFFNLIMAIIGCTQVFITPYIMTQGGPERSTYFYTFFLYDNGFTFVNMGVASAMAWLQLLFILALTALAFWSSKHWVHYQGK